MPRITKVYTRTGDDGMTGLGGGQRVGKDTLRIETYGTVDELNSILGVVLAAGVNETLAGALGTIQNELFHLGSDLCVLEEDKAKIPVPRIEEPHVVALENLMDRLSEELSPWRISSSPAARPAPRTCTSRARSAGAPSGSSWPSRARSRSAPGPCGT